MKIDGEERYFFDKRVVKKVLLKYGLIFLFCFPILILLNLWFNNFMPYFLVIIIDCAIVFSVVFVVNLIIDKIKLKKAEQKKIEELKLKKQLHVENRKSNKKSKIIKNENKKNNDNSSNKDNIPKIDDANE